MTVSFRSMGDVTTTDLLSQAHAGSAEAWSELVERYARLVWSIVRGYRLDAATAADVSQTVWLRLVEHLDRIRDPERLAGWLATTARNESLRALRRSARERPVAVFEDRADDVADPGDGLIAAEERDRLLAALDTLEVSCRELLRLTCADPPLDYQTIARIIDRPIGSIGPTRARCLERLRRALEATP